MENKSAVSKGLAKGTGDRLQKGMKEFWVVMVLYLDYSGSYVTTYICQNSLNCAL